MLLETYLKKLANASGSGHTEEACVMIDGYLSINVFANSALLRIAQFINGSPLLKGS
ncbi:MAG UNVERIFIED_CONTAM: hypothetical protein LVQ98_06045 [Rickettsiaceae bacterium]